MGAEHHVLVLQLGVAAFYHADHVAAFQVAARALRSHAGGHAQVAARHRLVGRHLLVDAVELHAGLREQLARGRHAEGVAVLQRGLLVRRYAALVHPAHAGNVAVFLQLGEGHGFLRARRGDGDHARGAVARRHFALLFAAGEVRAFLGGEAARLAGQDHDDLALHVDARVIVVLQAVGLDAVADEYQRRSGGGFVFQQAAGSHVVVEVGQLLGAGLAAQFQQRRFLNQARGAQRHLLQEAALVALGRQAVLQELRGDIVRRDVVAPAAGFAAFQQIVGQKGQVGLDHVFVGAHRGCVLRVGAGGHGQQAGGQYRAMFQHYVFLSLVKLGASGYPGRAARRVAPGNVPARPARATGWRSPPARPRRRSLSGCAPSLSWRCRQWYSCRP